MLQLLNIFVKIGRQLDIQYSCKSQGKYNSSYLLSKAVAGWVAP